MPQGNLAYNHPGSQHPYVMWIGWHYLSNAASLVLCAVYSVKDHHNLQDDSPVLKKTCVRQEVLDEWLPLSAAPLL